ncbi:TPA: hypothetical protein ACQTZH_005539 [Pseudomonas aeruginosa]
MNKANECTCPSGDGSLVHPCPAHPAVEQVGGDERAAFELFVRKHCGMPAHIAVNWDAKFTNDAWAGWQARAALAQPSPAHPAPVEQAGGDERAAFFKHLIGRHPAHETEIVRVVEHNYAAWKAWRARAALAQPSGEVVVTKNESGAIVSVTRQDKEGRVLSVIAESATLTAQAEQAEAERPEVVAWRYGFSGGIVSDKACLDEWKSGGEYQSLMTVAQHERIVGALRAERDGAIKLLGQSVWQKIERLTQERDAALARVAKLEHSQSFQRDIDYSVLSEYADKHRLHFNNLCAVVRSALIALPAQAQHSVPEGWMLVECGIWTQEQVDEMQRTVARFRSSEFVDDRALAMAVADAGQCKAPEISLAELLAAAPGNEGV